MGRSRRLSGNACGADKFRRLGNSGAAGTLLARESAPGREASGREHAGYPKSRTQRGTGQNCGVDFLRVFGGLPQRIVTAVLCRHRTFRYSRHKQLCQVYRLCGPSCFVPAVTSLPWDLLGKHSPRQTLASHSSGVLTQIHSDKEKHPAR